MIKSITKTQIIHQCEECKDTKVINPDDLIIGAETDENIIILPKCSCGAQEFLNRVYDNGGEHARIVNSLHHNLEKKGKVKNEVKDRLSSETEDDKPYNKENLTGKKLLNQGKFIPEVEEKIQETIRRKIPKPGSVGAVKKLLEEV